MDDVLTQDHLRDEVPTSGRYSQPLGRTHEVRAPSLGVFLVLLVARVGIVVTADIPTQIF